MLIITTKSFKIPTNLSIIPTKQLKITTKTISESQKRETPLGFLFFLYYYCNFHRYFEQISVYIHLQAASV